MSLFDFVDFHYIEYLAPPLIGAFIGYFTNRVAIRMLFRPLRSWRIWKIRIPMTPGVIPSKRHELAINIGEMVGEHLLTSREISKALKKEKFQKHLHGLIRSRISEILTRPLGSLSTIIPKKFNSYYDIAVKTFTYQVKSVFNSFVRSEEFENNVRQAMASSFQKFNHRDVNGIFSLQDREEFYLLLDKNLRRMLASGAMEQWISNFVHEKINAIVEKNRSLDDILPGSIKELLQQIVAEQTPRLLLTVAEMIKEPGVQDKVIAALRKGIDAFIDSLGPMSAVARNFLNMDTAEQKIREYLLENEQNISNWLQNEEFQSRVTAATLDRFNHLFRTPLTDFRLKDNHPIDVLFVSTKVSRYICAFMTEKSTSDALALMIRNTTETYIKGGSVELQIILQDLLGMEGKNKAEKWLEEEGVLLLRSPRTRETIDTIIEQMIGSLVQKPIGKLADIVPPGVREGMYNSVHRLAIAMLAGEVPGLVRSLNIRSIITEKVDSLDLLRLEGLLLSIMEEQFKYINLFGALLGFIIGCCNLVFLMAR